MWRKLRYTARLIYTFVRRYFYLLLIGIFLGVAGFWLTPRIINLIPKIRPTQTIGLIGLFQQNDIPEVILKQVSIGLTQLDEQGLPYPGLAKSWQVSDEGRIWTFELDDQLSWSDGQPIKASQIKYDFKDVTVTVLDDHHLQFKLQDPFSPFPTVVSTPVLRDDLVGIGPYKFTRLHREGNYFKSINLMPVSKGSTLPKLRYLFYGTEEAAKTAFKLGEINQVVGLINAQEFADWSMVKTTAQEHPYRYVGLFFNMDNLQFKQKSVRQALAYAIKDKSAGFRRVISPIMESSWAYNAHVKPYDYDQERAKKLVGEEDLEAAKSQPIQLATVASLLPVADQIANDWTEFGMPTQVRVINSLPENFDAILVTQEVPKDPDQYVLWHSTQSTNITHYQSPKIDKLLEDGRKELNQDERLEIYLDFQRYLVEDVPAIFLFQPVTYTIERI